MPESEAESKKCTTCLQVKELLAFPNDKSCKYGKSPRCKECLKAYMTEYRLRNKERAKEYRAKHYQENAEHIKAKSAAWYASNPDKVRARTAAYYAADPEKYKAYSAAYRAENKEKTLARVAKWRDENREKAREYSRVYAKENPEIMRTLWQNKRALKRANGGRLSHGLAERLFKLQKGKCVCCDEPLGDDYHLDHIMPLALGGPNEDWNIQLLRGRCNLQKKAKHPVDFMQSRGFLL